VAAKDDKRMATEIVVAIAGLIGLLTALVQCGTAAIEVQPGPGPAPAPWTEPGNPPQPTINYDVPGNGPPYYNDAGQRVDRYGNPCGGYSADCY
jgi:hypothetical protein